MIVKNIICENYLLTWRPLKLEQRRTAQDNKARLSNPVLAVDGMCLCVCERGARYPLDILKWEILKGVLQLH